MKDLTENIYNNIALLWGKIAWDCLAVFLCFFAFGSGLTFFGYCLHFTLYTLHFTLHINHLLINDLSFKSVKCKGVYTLDFYKLYSKKIFFLKKSVKLTLFILKLLSISALRCKGICKPPLHSFCISY